MYYITCSLIKVQFIVMMCCLMATAHHNKLIHDTIIQQRLPPKDGKAQTIH